MFSILTNFSNKITNAIKHHVPTIVAVAAAATIAAYAYGTFIELRAQNRQNLRLVKEEWTDKVADRDQQISNLIQQLGRSQNENELLKEENSKLSVALKLVSLDHTLDEFNLGDQEVIGGTQTSQP